MEQHPQEPERSTRESSDYKPESANSDTKSGKVDLRRHAGNSQAKIEARCLMRELRDRREVLGLSQTEVAKRMGTSQRTVSMIENCVNTPKIGVALLMAEVLGLTLQYEPRNEGDNKITLEEVENTDTQRNT